MPMGNIFDIERFSTKDGQGIRTVIFLKGCSMRCPWCHNPEGIHCNYELMLNPQLCIDCGSCIKACKHGAIVLENGQRRFDAKKCIQCMDCAKVCFSGALKQVGKDMTVDEVMQQVLQDRVLYEKSGGGITLTGGEVMLQPDFTKQLLQRCKENHISTAIETNLIAPWRDYAAILPYVDMFYVDIKHIDPVKHKDWIGVSNESAIENLRHLKDAGCVMVVRTPVIPGFNDDDETIASIAKLISDIPTLSYYELLSYNPLGKSKGTLVNPPDIKSFEIPTRERMRQLAQLAGMYITRVRIDGKLKR